MPVREWGGMLSHNRHQLPLLSCTGAGAMASLYQGLLPGYQLSDQGHEPAFYFTDLSHQATHCSTTAVSDT